MRTEATRRAINGASVIEIVRRAEVAGTIRLSDHARKRMKERGVRAGDISKAIWTVQSAKRQESDKNWRLKGGVDTDGDDLMIVIDLDQDPIVLVTLM